MGAQTLIQHALIQGTGVSLAKITDTAPASPRRFFLPVAPMDVVPITVNLSRAYPICDGCDGAPQFAATDREGWVTVMCASHVARWGVLR